MEIERKLITKASLERLYEKLQAKGNKIYAPVTKDGKTEFRYNPSYTEVTYDHIQTTQSLKNTVFPKIENLIHFKTDKSGTEITEVDLSKIPSLVLWGVHPCDAAGFDAIKSIFMWDYKDEYFSSRLQKIAIIGLSCNTCDDNCFCTSVGLNPRGIKGSDILLTKLTSGDYLAEVITEKGMEIINAAPELFEAVPSEAKEESIAQVKTYFSQEKVTKNLAGAFNNPFWVENFLRCIGCGACAAACKNGSAMLFVAAKVSQLALLPQGRVEASHRAKVMVAKMDELGFGNCTNTGACEAECPKAISISHIARLNREFLAAKFKD